MTDSLMETFIKVPDPLGISTYLISLTWSFISALDGSLVNGVLTGCMTILGGIYMYMKIKGQQLDNQKKKLKFFA